MRPLPQKSKVVLLGAAGGMGRVAAELVAAMGNVSELVLADRNLSGAAKLATELDLASQAAVRAVGVDVTDLPALGALLEPADVVLNTSGPFYRFGVPILRTAIETGCHYLDICDDWEPTIEMLALAEEARAAGVCAVIGIGASPGALNLLARLACERLDVVEDLHTVWPIDAGEGGASAATDTGGQGAAAAVVHWMQQISGTIETVEDGVRVSSRPIVPVRLRYPQVGEGTAYTVGHPEPITLHATMKVQGRSANLMLLQPMTAAFLDVLRDDIDRGRLSCDRAADLVFRPGRIRSLRAAWRRPRFEGPGGLPPFFAVACGTRDGEGRLVGAHVEALPEGMARVTSVPLALGLQQLLAGQIASPGVHPPEAVILPEPLFDGLAQACDPPLATMADMVRILEEPAASAGGSGSTRSR